MTRFSTTRLFQNCSCAYLTPTLILIPYFWVPVKALEIFASKTSSHTKQASKRAHRDAEDGVVGSAVVWGKFHLATNVAKYAYSHSKTFLIISTGGQREVVKGSRVWEGGRVKEWMSRVRIAKQKFSYFHLLNKCKICISINAYGGGVFKKHHSTSHFFARVHPMPLCSLLMLNVYIHTTTTTKSWRRAAVYTEILRMLVQHSTAHVRSRC